MFFFSKSGCFPDVQVLLLNNGGGIFMSVKDVLKVSRKTYINPSAWFGYNEFKRNGKYVWGVLRNLFVVPESESIQTETFEQALTRHHLTETNVKEIQKDYFFYAGIFLLLSFFSCVAGFYFLFVAHSFADLLLGLAVSALFASQAFRYHFWYFQIKQRKLGCTFQEWRDAMLGRDSRPKT